MQWQFGKRGNHFEIYIITENVSWEFKKKTEK
jgi:hypothetical protein